jgi:nitrite reductase/ring-hydroxylating ferredoxin subunit
MSPHDEEKTAVGPDGKPLAEQPAWRQDFPLDWPEDNYVARRDFTKFLVLTSLAFAVGQFWILVQNWRRRWRGEPPIRAIARLDEVPVGASRVFRYPEEEDACLLIRPAEGTLLAYDQKCTHLSCAVTPDLVAGRLLCPCHHGVFDLASGRPLAGPPRRPLTRILVEERAGLIYAIGIARSTV